MWVLESTDEEKLVEAECRPALFRKITQQNVSGTTEAKRTACQHECSVLLRAIFVGSLQAKVVKPAAPMKETTQEIWELLVNRVETKPLTTRITSALTEARREVSVLGWVDTAGFPLLKAARDRDVRVRVVTHTASKREMRFKEAMRELIMVLGREAIRLEPLFHSRLLIVDDFVFVGGVDLTSDSLSHRIECAIWTNSPSVVASAKELFEECFTRGTPPRTRT